MFYSISNNNPHDTSKNEYIGSINEDRVIAKSNFGLDASENWLTAAEECDSVFLGSLADDDFIYHHDDLSEWRASDDISGYRPNIAIWESGYGLRGSSIFEITGDTPIQRVDEYFKKNGGNNLTLY